MRTALTDADRVGAVGNAVLVAMLCALCALCTACATYHRSSVEIKLSFAESDFDRALERIEKIDRGTSELLYLYEKGLVLHYDGRYEESNDVFQRAELLIEELYTKSVSRELAALALTDNIARYRGTAYEAILVNYYKILNYLYLGDLAGAVVECRRVNRKLEYLRDTEGVFYSNDPFVQYLTGMVYDAARELADADVSYRVALEEYRELAPGYGVDVPRALPCDARAVAEALGEAQAGAASADSGAADCPPRPSPGQGVLNVLLECGYVAHKQERKVVLPIFEDDDTGDADALAEVLAAREGVPVASYEGRRRVAYVLKVAVPALVPTPVPWAYAVVTPRWVEPLAVDSTDAPAAAECTRPAQASPARTDLVENVDAYAAAAFEEGYGKILVRTVVRALAKYAAKEGASKKDETLGWVVNWFNVATESADTREWTTLPQKILMARLVLDAGRYDLRVELYDERGRPVDAFVIEGATVLPGRVGFLNHRVF